MIELTPTTALMVYLGMTLAGLLGLWTTQHYLSKKKPLPPAEKTMSICEFCHFAYLDEESKSITRCPRCQSYNTQKKK